MELLPLERGGEFAGMLDRCIEAARLFCERVVETEHYVPVHAPDLDIVVYAVDAASASASSNRARAIFEAAAAKDLHLALMNLPLPIVQSALPELAGDSDTVTCLRSTFMKPEQVDWVPEIVSILEAVAETD